MHIIHSLVMTTAVTCIFLRWSAQSPVQNRRFCSSDHRASCLKYVCLCAHAWALVVLVMKLHFPRFHLSSRYSWIWCGLRTHTFTGSVVKCKQSWGNRGLRGTGLDTRTCINTQAAIKSTNQNNSKGKKLKMLFSIAAPNKANESFLKGILDS